MVIQERSRRSFRYTRRRRQITMVTQRRMRELKIDLSNTIKLVNGFITTNEWNITFTKNIHEKPMIDQLNLFSNELTDYGDILPEKDENDKLLKQYEETNTKAKATLIILKQVISQKEAEEKEKEKQLEIEQRNREKQMEINAEIEKDKLRSHERIELDRLNLEKAKLELEAKPNVKRVNIELKVKEIELEKERTTS